MPLRRERLSDLVGLVYGFFVAGFGALHFVARVLRLVAEQVVLHESVSVKPSVCAIVNEHAVSKELVFAFNAQVVRLLDSSGRTHAKNTTWSSNQDERGIGCV